MTSTRAPAAAPSLSQISLRERERGFVVGGVDSGKSTLCDYLRQEFITRYFARGGRCLILDSKPRYRAQYTVAGTSAAHRYRNWEHGPAVAGSVVVDSPDELKSAWRLGARVVIAQCETSMEIGRLVATARAFLRDSKANRPQLVQVDETLDFFHSNGAPRGGDDTIVQLARAGRERGTAVMYASQRTKGIPPTLMGEMSRLYALRIDYVSDAKRLQEMGAPPFPMPTRPQQFMYWWKGDRAHPEAYRQVFGPYRLELPR